MSKHRCKVTNVYHENCTVRVALSDKKKSDGSPFVSYPLQVWQPIAGEDCRTYHMPKVGDYVWVEFLDNGKQEGLIVGSAFTERTMPREPMSEGEDGELYGREGLYRTQYSDDTIIEYDLKESKYRIYTKTAEIEIEGKDGKIRITADASVTIESPEITIEAPERETDEEDDGEGEGDEEKESGVVRIKANASVTIESPEVSIEGKLTARDGIFTDGPSPNTHAHG